MGAVKEVVREHDLRQRWLEAYGVNLRTVSRKTREE